MKQRALVYAIPFVWLLLSGCAVSYQQSSSAQRTLSAPEPTVSTSPKPENDSALIKPGHSVGLVRLGDTREQVLKVLGEKREEYTHDDPCKYTEMHWYDVERDRNGIFVYLKEGLVFQIEAATSRYHTAEGIMEESSPEEVRRSYTQLRSYQLLRSGADIVGGRDLIYWVNQQNGIAFEFYYNHKVTKRRVSKVIVFEPGSNFAPAGCVSPPQQLRELKPLVLEPPGSKE